MTTTKTPSRVTKGMQFRSIIADCNALWEVMANAGRGVWHCQVVNEPVAINGRVIDSDCVGVTDVFRAEAILAAVRQADLFDRLAARDAAEANTYPAGTTVHAEAGWKGQWIRGTVIDTDDGKQIVPTALIGEFRPHDLPRRNPDGTINPGGYHAKAVADADPRRLVARNLWESGDNRFNGLPDPTTADPVDLTVPPMTDAEQARAAKIRTCMAITETLKDSWRPDFDVDAALLAVRRLTADA